MTRLKLFFSTFTVVFLAELGDKTQIESFSMAAENGSVLSVIIGAASPLPPPRSWPWWRVTSSPASCPRRRSKSSRVSSSSLPAPTFWSVLSSSSPPRDSDLEGGHGADGELRHPLARASRAPKMESKEKREITERRKRREREER
jgi:hypothetical protein